jgi:hypothetical protein
MSEKYPVSEKSHFSLWGSDTREEKKGGGECGKMSSRKSKWLKICGDQGKKEKKGINICLDVLLHEIFDLSFFVLNRPHLGLFHNLKCFRI